MTFLHCWATHAKTTLLTHSNKPRDHLTLTKYYHHECEATAHWGAGCINMHFAVLCFPCLFGSLPAPLSTKDELKVCLAASRSEAMNIRNRVGLTKLRSHLWKASAMIWDNFSYPLKITYGGLTLLLPPQNNWSKTAQLNYWLESALTAS